MKATVANMRRCEEAGIKAVMYDPATGEQSSANPADYFWAADDDPFGDCVLVTRQPAQLLDIEINETELTQ